MSNKSQGEIFGIALMFVIIIVGILIYGQVKSVIDVGDEDNSQKYRYEVLADGIMNTLLKMSTGCDAYKNQDKLEDLISYCEYKWGGDDPEITCENLPNPVGSCKRTIDILNESLRNLLNSSDAIGPIPYKLVIFAPSSSSSHLNVNITNLGSFEYRGTLIDESNYLRNGFKRVSSGPRKVQTSKRNVDFELFLYYR